MPKPIAIACDHAALDLKNTLKEYLLAHAYEVEDLGTDSTESVDYPDFAHAMAQKIESKAVERGILLCGSGIGISMAANRHPHIRAALCHNQETATLSRQHNDANVLVLGARIIDNATAISCADAFLNTAFEGGRHTRRVEKIEPTFVKKEAS